KDLGAGDAGRRGGVRGLARPRERAVGRRRRRRVALLVALQVVPLREDDAAEAVDRRREGAARRVLEELERARRLIERVDAGDRRRRLVLVALRVVVRGAARRTVGREKDAVVARVDRRHVVEAGRLPGDRADARDLALPEA